MGRAGMGTGGFRGWCEGVEEAEEVRGKELDGMERGVGEKGARLVAIHCK